MTAARVLVAVSALLLLHSAFSVFEHLSTLKALGRPATAKDLPMSITYEAFAALALFLPAITLAMPALEDLTYRGEMAKRSPDDADARMGFMRPSARGRALFGDAPKPSASS